MFIKLVFYSVTCLLYVQQNIGIYEKSLVVKILVKTYYLALYDEIEFNRNV